MSMTTLLGRNLKDKSKKESLSVERSKLRDALVALSRLEFKHKPSFPIIMRRRCEEAYP